MADPAQFDHDRLGHILSDRLLKVPRFQRSYAWEAEHIQEFLRDLERARATRSKYFVGTVVLAADDADNSRQIIVDGQQRLTTAAILLMAARDRLRQLGKTEIADSVDNRFLRRFEMQAEDILTRLTLNPDNLDSYESLLSEDRSHLSDTDPLATCYDICLEHVRGISSKSAHRPLVDLVSQLEDDVQILLAVASSVSEAYVIFETLNDRGADLTTADLLKNYLFSKSGDYLDYVERRWVEMASVLDKPEDLVKFIRHEYSSRHGKVTARQLYRGLQDDIGDDRRSVKEYVSRLGRALERYTALRDPEDSFWDATSADVRDALLAMRRFRFESSMPLLLAAFEMWEQRKAARLAIKIVGWSVRAQYAGRLGGGTAEDAFGDAALAVTEGRATNQAEVLKELGRLVPSDEDFRQAFVAAGSIQSSRAKYVLSRMEREHRRRAGQSEDGIPDWSSRSVTTEHIYPQSKAKPSEEGKTDSLAGNVASLWNLTLLEKSLNRGLGGKAFAEKKNTYRSSAFAITKAVSELDDWTAEEARARLDDFADLAVRAWPLR